MGKKRFIYWLVFVFNSSFARAKKETFSMLLMLHLISSFESVFLFFLPLCAGVGWQCLEKQKRKQTKKKNGRVGNGEQPKKIVFSIIIIWLLIDEIVSFLRYQSVCVIRKKKKMKMLCWKKLLSLSHASTLFLDITSIFNFFF